MEAGGGLLRSKEELRCNLVGLGSRFLLPHSQRCVFRSAMEDKDSMACHWGIKTRISSRWQRNKKNIRYRFSKLQQAGFFPFAMFPNPKGLMCQLHFKFSWHNEMLERLLFVQLPMGNPSLPSALFTRSFVITIFRLSSSIIYTHENRDGSPDISCSSLPNNLMRKSPRSKNPANPDNNLLLQISHGENHSLTPITQNIAMTSFLLLLSHQAPSRIPKNDSSLAFAHFPARSSIPVPRKPRKTNP